MASKDDDPNATQPLPELAPSVWARDLIVNHAQYLLWLSAAQAARIIDFQEYMILLAAHNAFVDRVWNHYHPTESR